MTEEELNVLGQLIQKSLPQGTAWYLVMVPPHACADGGSACPVQTVGNLDMDQAQRVLSGALGMLEDGTHDPMFARPLEKSH